MYPYHYRPIVSKAQYYKTLTLFTWPTLPIEIIPLHRVIVSEGSFRAKLPCLTLAVITIGILGY